MADVGEMEVIEAFARGLMTDANGAASDHPVLYVDKPPQLYDVFGGYGAKPEREAAVPAHE